MREFYWAGIALLAAACCGCSSADVDWDQLDDGVVRLVTAVGEGSVTGSAFAVDDQGHFVTNHHVIKDSLAGNSLVALEAIVPELKVHPATVVWHSAEKDLAIVKIADWKRPALVLATEQSVRKNQPVRSIGFPAASDLLGTEKNPAFLEPKIKSGVISARHEFPVPEHQVSVRWFEHDATINPGNSGGPLLDLCGRVVGVNTLGVLPGRGFGTFFSQRVDEVQKVLLENKIEFAEDTSACLASDVGLRQWIYLLAAGLMLMLAGATYVFWRLQQQLAGRPINTRMLRQAFKEVGVTRLLAPSRLAPRPAPASDAETVRKTTLVPENSSQPVISLLPGKKVTVGRDPRAVDVVVTDEAISRQHVRIQCVADHVEVEDLNSFNGSYIDGKRLRAGEPVELRPRQRLTLGSERVAYRLTET